MALTEAELAFIMKKLELAGRLWTAHRHTCFIHFYSLKEPTDIENMWLELRAKGETISVATVRNVLHLLLQYNFAERCFNEMTGRFEYLPVSTLLNA